MNGSLQAIIPSHVSAGASVRSARRYPTPEKRGQPSRDDGQNDRSESSASRFVWITASASSLLNQ